MKFLIKRASFPDNRQQPCKDAKLKREIYFRSGEYRDTEWEIEINHFDELMRLIEEVGDIVITKDNKIIIYDDYIE